MFNLIIAAAEDAGFIDKLLPHDKTEVWWGSASFFIVVGLIVWKAGPAIKGAWNGRIERIEGEIAAATSARAEAEAAVADVQERIGNVDVERQRILAEAHQTANALKAQLVAKAEQDAADLQARAAADVESAKSQVLADLRAEVAQLALGAAEAVVASNLDAGTQHELIEAYISKVGTPS